MSYYNPDKRQVYYQQRFVEVAGKCEICGGQDRLVIDHDHQTGKLRGLLCYRHNTGLGLFRDNPILLEKAAAYLRAAGTTGAVWIPKRNRKIANVPRFVTPKLIQREYAMELLKQPWHKSDRARARLLAQTHGISYTAAQARICRLRRDLECEAQAQNTASAPSENPTNL